MRTDVLPLAVDILALVFGHPGASLLAFARMKVGIEDSQIGAVLVEDLISLHVGVINGNILVLLEGDAIEPVSQAEDSLDNLGEFEIGT